MIAGLLVFAVFCAISSTLSAGRPFTASLVRSYIADAKIDISNMSPEQSQAMDALVNKTVAALNAHGGRGSISIVDMGPIMNDLFRESRAIMAWPGGKKPGMEKKNDDTRRPENTRQRPNDPSPEAAKAAEKNAEKIEKAKEAYPGCPYDNLDKIKDLNLTPAQKQKVDTLRTQRQRIMAKSVKTAKSKRYGTASRRSLYRVLRYFVSLYNHRIYLTFTPRQVDVFKRHLRDGDGPMEVDSLEDLLNGIPERDVFGDDGQPDWQETGDRKRLTRTNFGDYDEFRTLLNLDDDQLHELAALDGEARGVCDAAVEAILADRNAAARALRETDDAFEAIRIKTRKLIPRGQREHFDALMLLLLDALEFPAQNRASFALFELQDSDAERLDAVLTTFARGHVKQISDPAEVSLVTQRLLQGELETKAREVLSRKDQTTWNDTKATYRIFYDAVKKYKEQ